MGNHQQHHPNNHHQTQPLVDENQTKETVLVIDDYNSTSSISESQIIGEFQLKDSPSEIKMEFILNGRKDTRLDIMHFRVVRNQEYILRKELLVDNVCSGIQSKVSFHFSKDSWLLELRRNDTCQILFSGSGEVNIRNLIVLVAYTTTPSLKHSSYDHTNFDDGKIILPFRINNKGVPDIHGTVEFDSSPAFIQDIMSRPSEFIRSVWSKHHPPLPEYQKAANLIILEPQWISHTVLLRHLDSIKKEFRSDAALEQRLLTGFEQILLNAISKAYPDCGNPRIQQDMMLNCNIFNTIMPFYHGLRWRKSYFAYSLSKFYENESRDTIVAKLSEICDRASRCQSAQRQAFNVLICAAQRNKKGSKDVDIDLTTREGALTRFYECMEDYLDDHKERAFKSSFMEPARFYYHLLNNHMGRDHVNVHGLNWYLALLHSTLSMQLPLMPTLSDPDILSVIDFWHGLSDEAWTHFSDPNNFGIDFEGIKALNKKGSFIRSHMNDGTLPNFHRNPTPKFLGNTAVDPSPKMAGKREQLAIYLERFAYFFSRDFFIRKSFEALNSELKPEHAGFRRAAETLFKLYKEEFGLTEDSLVEYCYTDDYYTTLDLGKTEHFYAWLRITKAVVLEEPNLETLKGNSECLICFEQKKDIKAVRHNGCTVGDVSGHRMCGDCRRKFLLCPFCQVPVRSEEDEDSGEGAIAANIVAYITSGNTDPTYLASSIEEWQLFETTNDWEPEVIGRTASLVLRDPRFEAFLRRGVEQRLEYLRDSAGLIFRLYSLYIHDDQLADLPRQTSADLAASLGVILEEIEKDNPPDIHGHNLGALYQQALSAWVCAFGSGKMDEVNGTLKTLVRRVGHALIGYLRSKSSASMKAKLRAEFKERIFPDILLLAQEPIWGSAEEDIVWQHYII